MDECNKYYSEAILQLKVQCHRLSRAHHRQNSLVPSWTQTDPPHQQCFLPSFTCCCWWKHTCTTDTWGGMLKNVSHLGWLWSLYLPGSRKTLTTMWDAIFQCWKIYLAFYRDGKWHSPDSARLLNSMCWQSRAVKGKVTSLKQAEQCLFSDVALVSVWITAAESFP